jgi:excisionase family DNA binding protein
MEWLTPEETAEYLKIHKHTVYEYIKKNKIPAVKFGR